MSDELEEMMKELEANAEMQNAKLNAMRLLRAYRMGPDPFREELQRIGNQRELTVVIWGALFNLNWFFERWVKERSYSGEFEDADAALDMFIDAISDQD